MIVVVAPLLSPELTLCPDLPGPADPGGRAASGCPTVLVVAGEADLATAGQLRAQLDQARARAGCGALVVDVADLSSCDLYGLDVLQQARCGAVAADVPFSLRGARPGLTWLDRRFPHRHLAQCA